MMMVTIVRCLMLSILIVLYQVMIMVLHLLAGHIGKGASGAPRQQQHPKVAGHLDEGSSLPAMGSGGRTGVIEQGRHHVVHKSFWQFPGYPSSLLNFATVALPRPQSSPPPSRRKKSWRLHLGGWASSKTTSSRQSSRSAAVSTMAGEIPKYSNYNADVGATGTNFDNKSNFPPF